MEGTIALLRASLVIFNSMGGLLKQIYTFEHSIEAINNYINNIRDTTRFQKDMNAIYMNKTILERIRNTIYNIEHDRFASQNYKNKPKETCNEMTPYCFASDEFFQNRCSDYVIKINNIIGNLKASYFNPFYGKKLVDKVKKLSLPPRIMNIVKDKKGLSVAHILDFDIKNQVKKLHTSIRDGKIEDLLKDDIFKSQQDDDRFSDLMEEDFNEQSITISFTVDREPEKKVVNEQILVNRGSSLSGLSSYKYHKDNIKNLPLLIQTDCNDILCFRTSHGCDLLELESENQSFLDKTKQVFFDKVNQNLMNYLGSTITNHIKRGNKIALDLNKPGFKNKKPNALALKPSYKLRRTSFDVKKQKKFISLNLKRPRHFDLESKKHQAHLYYPRKQTLRVLEMSMQYKIDPLAFLETNDVKTTEDDFFDTFDKRYKFSMNDYLDFQSPRLKPNRMGIKHLI